MRRRAARAPAQTVSSAFSATDGVLRPWDVSFEIVVFDKRLAYSLSENIQALSEEEKEDRLVYRSVRLKKRWIKQAADMGFDEVEGVVLSSARAERIGQAGGKRIVQAGAGRFRLALRPRPNRGLFTKRRLRARSLTKKPLRNRCQRRFRRAVR